MFVPVATAAAAAVLLMMMAIITPAAHAYSAGAPTSICDSMVPAHHTDAQTSESPYRLLVSSNKVRHGDVVTVTIDGVTAANTIKGFLVEALQNKKPVGWFDASGETKYAQTIDCFGKAQVNQI